jgi:hypothetical protein
MSDKALSDMNEQEILDEIRSLRERRAQRQEDARKTRTAKVGGSRRKSRIEEVDGVAGSILDDLLG